MLLLFFSNVHGNTPITRAVAKVRIVHFCPLGRRVGYAYILILIEEKKKKTRYINYVLLYDA